MTDTRRTPRLEVLTLIQGESDCGHTVTILNISRGGLLVASSRALTVGRVHDFRFSTPGATALAMVFGARVIHTRQANSDDDEPWVTGLEFTPAATERQRLAIEILWSMCQRESDAADSELTTAPPSNGTRPQTR